MGQEVKLAGSGSTQKPIVTGLAGHILPPVGAIVGLPCRERYIFIYQFTGLDTGQGQ